MESSATLRSASEVFLLAAGMLNDADAFFASGLDALSVNQAFLLTVCLQVGLGGFQLALQILDAPCHPVGCRLRDLEAGIQNILDVGLRVGVCDVGREVAVR